MSACKISSYDKGHYYQFDFVGISAFFKDGVEWIESKTGKKVLGVLPWYHHFRLDAEDSVEIEQCPSISTLKDDIPAIAVIKLKHISNFTDFHALSETPDLRLCLLKTRLISQDLKLSSFRFQNTRSDIRWLKHMEWDKRIIEYAESGGHVLGICGGYQILGRYVDDPEGVEDTPGKTEALNLLDVYTILKSPKTTTLSTFSWGEAGGEGYEIHMGYTERMTSKPMLRIQSRNRTLCADHDGAVSDRLNVSGTYIHGLFDMDKIKYKWLNAIGIETIPHGAESDLSRKEKVTVY